MTQATTAVVAASSGIVQRKMGRIMVIAWEITFAIGK